MGASPTADGPRWGEEEGTRLLEDVSGGDDDDTVSDDNHNENLFQKNVVDYIRIRGNLADTYSDDEIHRAIGILRWILRSKSKLKKYKVTIVRTNAFQVEHDYMKAVVKGVVKKGIIWILPQN